MILGSLRRVFPAWLDSKTLQAEHVRGRSLGVALKQLADEGVAQSVRGPGNVFLYRAERLTLLVDRSDEARGVVVLKCPTCGAGMLPGDPDGWKWYEDDLRSWDLELTNENGLRVAASNDGDSGGETHNGRVGCYVCGEQMDLPDDVEFDFV